LTKLSQRRNKTLTIKGKFSENFLLPNFSLDRKKQKDNFEDEQNDVMEQADFENFWFTQKTRTRISYAENEAVIEEIVAINFQRSKSFKSEVPAILMGED